MENGKKENRDEATARMLLGDFIDIYKESDMYMVQDILPQMTG